MYFRNVGNHYDLTKRYTLEDTLLCDPLTTTVADLPWN